MNIKALKAQFPQIEVEELFPYFPRIPMSDYPELEGYSWQDCHKGFLGAGGLFLVSEITNQMELKPGMRILDLCCGNCASSIFLAKHYDVHVLAVDINMDPTANWERVKIAGLSEEVTPLQMNARNLLLPHCYFDAIFCMNSYFYFGTDDLYLPYLLRFLRPGGRIGIASPCYAAELKPTTPREFYYDAPDFAESYAVHSPSWWYEHFAKTGLVDIHICQENPKGREFWLDNIRWQLEKQHPRDMTPGMKMMVEQEIVMLLTDQERFVTYLTLIAEKIVNEDERCW